MYLAATIGHCNRYVINWPVPSPMDTDRYWNYPEEVLKPMGDLKPSTQVKDYSLPLRFFQIL